MNVFDQKIITENLRKCQKEAYEAIQHHYSNNVIKQSQSIESSSHRIEILIRGCPT
jgi:hypothetical protein